jgi:hypothetical protein
VWLWQGVLVLVLPLCIYAIDDDRFFNRTARDAWIYYGYFKEASTLLSLHPDAYYGSRLSVILPGWIAHRWLEPLPAHLALHFSLYWVASLSFWFWARKHLADWMAFLATVVLVGHAGFIASVSWDYVDGFGIAYFLLANALVCHAGNGGRRSAFLVGAGLSLGALITANLFYLVLTPLTLAELYFEGQRSRSRAAGDLGALTVGFAISLSLFGLASRALGGDFLYLKSSIVFVGRFVDGGNIWRRQSWAWLPNAYWLATPIAALLGGLLRRRAGGDACGVVAGRRPAWLAQSQMWLLTIIVLVYCWALDGTPYEKFYYMSIFLPSSLLGLAVVAQGLVGRVWDGMTQCRGMLLGVVGAVVLPYALSRASLPSLDRSLPLATLTLVMALLSLRVGGPRRAFVVAAVVLIFLANVSITGSSATTGSADAFQQISKTIDAVRAEVGVEAARLWFDVNEKEVGRRFDAIASAFLLCPHLVNEDFPKLNASLMCDHQEIRAETRIILLSSQENALELATDALGDLTLNTRLHTTMRVDGATPFYSYFLDLTGRPPATSGVNFGESARLDAVVEGFYKWEAGVRWLGERGTLRMSSGRVLEIIAAAPITALRDQNSAGRVPTVRVSIASSRYPKTQLGVLRLLEDSPTAYRFQVPEELRLPSEAEVELILEASNTWRPSEVLEGSIDHRELSVMVLAVSTRDEDSG